MLPDAVPTTAPGTLVAYGMVAYHDAWHAAHRLTVDILLACIDNLPGPVRHSDISASASMQPRLTGHEPTGNADRSDLCRAPARASRSSTAWWRSDGPTAHRCHNRRGTDVAVEPPSIGLCARSETMTRAEEPPTAEQLAHQPTPQDNPYPPDATATRSTPPPAQQPSDPTTEWELLMHGSYPPAQWLRILNAADQADHGAGVDGRASPQWCRSALLAAGPWRTPQRGADWYGDRIAPDLDLLRRWLRAPVVHADGLVTVADTLDLADLSTAAPWQVHDALESLLAGAGRAGLFGLAGANIEVDRLTDRHGLAAGLLLVVRPTTGPGIATARIRSALADGFVGDRADDGVRLLATAANHIDSTLDKHDGTASARTDPPARHARPFPTLAVPASAAGTTSGLRITTSTSVTGRLR
jgi:hypothetical protein